MATISELLNDYDWEEAFSFLEHGEYRPATPDGEYNLSHFKTVDIDEIAGHVEGENDGESWVVYGSLRDGTGRWFALDAWCDYTGWDCQSGGVVSIANSREECERFCLADEDRRRLGVTLND